MRNSYPLPQIDDLLDRLATACVFSKIDLRAGYHQVSIEDADVHKTAFLTRYGLFEFVVLPFGLTGAPATFQRLMNSTFARWLDDFVTVYLDDILVFSPDEATHEAHLQKVLTRLREAKLFAKRSKCEFGLPSVEYLGHFVGGGQRWMDPSKIEAVRSWEAPTTVK